MKSLKVLVSGCGSIGRRHLQNLKKLGIENLSIFDPVTEAVQAAAKDLEITKVFSDYDKALAEAPAIVVVASPPAFHIEQALKAAKAGCHLFIEKPLSHNRNGLAELIDHIRKKALISLVGCNLRFHPGIKKVKEWLDRKKLGALHEMKIEFGYYLPNWRPKSDYRKNYAAKTQLGGGIVLDAIHELDYLYWFLGKPEKIQADCRKESDLEIETEDTADINARYPNAISVQLHLDYLNPQYNRCLKIIGDNGSILWDWNHGAELRDLRGKCLEYFETSGFEPNQMYADEMQHFLNCVEKKQQTICPVSAGAEVLELALQAKESSFQKIALFLQARMGSSRLPGKVMKDVLGQPLLFRICERLEKVRHKNLLAVLSTTNPLDDPIEEFLKQKNIQCYRGSEQDVLDRFYQAAKKLKSDTIVRLTADCAVLDPSLIDQMIEFFKKGKWDYVSNTLIPTYPDGLDVEIFSFQALEKAWKEAKQTHQREHVTAFFYENPDTFRLANYRNAADYSQYRWLVDEPVDLEFIRALYERLHPHNPFFGFQDILDLMAKEPELLKINSGYRRNEGFFKSIAGDKIFYKDWAQYIREIHNQKGCPLYETVGT